METEVSKKVANTNGLKGLEVLIKLQQSAYQGNFQGFSSMLFSFILTPKLWQMTPHKSHTQNPSQGNASLVLKKKRKECQMNMR